MANKDIPNGLVPVDGTGGAHCISMNPYVIASGDGTAVGVGCPLKLAGSMDDATGYPTAIRATAGDACCGVVVGFLADKDYENQTHRSASTRRIALVADSPEQLFSIQEDSVGGALAAANVGQNADMIFASVNTTTGLSGVELDSSTAASGNATYVLKILRLDPAVDNAVGTNARWIVKINNHQFGSHTGTAGV
jgi:hypothetical protein